VGQETATDDEIRDLFLDAIETFPAGYQAAAEKWLTDRMAAHLLVQEMLTKGASPFA